VAEKQGVNDVAERAFRRHYGQVYRFVRRRTADHHRAEELTQQVFADAASSLRGSSAPTLAWLYTVAKRRFADEVRRNVRGDALTVAVAEPTEAREYGRDVTVALRDAVARLPQGQRDVVVLKLLRGARFAEIGRLLGISEEAAKMRFVRALEALRAELEQEGIQP
jgi:RNA polymerase sigma-70 factor (ECF subfamily)